MKEEGRRKKEEGRRKKEEGRRKKEEGRRKREEGRKISQCRVRIANLTYCAPYLVCQQSTVNSQQLTISSF
ncbi:hypothetical protein QUA13_09870 [Microcoleus sp. S28C3]|uniref:hypothetical protein n=1 Tax=Microcoleus sp. S28C3 TaxID=3055414 RepID=UPI002FD746B8